MEMHSPPHACAECSATRLTRASSVEYLSPSLHSSLRHASLHAAVYALCGTILGGGVLSLPFCFSLLGLFGGVIVLIVIAVASDFSIYILVRPLHSPHVQHIRHACWLMACVRIYAVCLSDVCVG